MPQNHTLLPSGPGTYSDWPVFVGAPTPWQAVSGLEGAYLQSGVAGQRHSFPVGLPSIPADDTLVSAIVRGFASMEQVPPVPLGNPGFETSASWTLDSTCDQPGALYSADTPHSGSRCMSITSQLLGGVSVCGEFYQLLSGFVPGKTYRLAIWHRETGGPPQRTASITLDGVAIGSISGTSSGWLRSTFDFVATAISHVLMISQDSGASATAFMRFFDDLQLDPVVVAGLVVPFYRLWGKDVELTPWNVPLDQATALALPDRPISLLAYELINGGFEIGIKNGANSYVRVDQVKVDVVLAAVSERQALVGAIR